MKRLEEQPGLGTRGKRGSRQPEGAHSEEWPSRVQLLTFPNGLSALQTPGTVRVTNGRSRQGRAGAEPRPRQGPSPRHMCLGGAHVSSVPCFLVRPRTCDAPRVARLHRWGRACAPDGEQHGLFLSPSHRSWPSKLGPGLRASVYPLGHPARPVETEGGWISWSLAPHTSRRCNQHPKTNVSQKVELQVQGYTCTKLERWLRG